MGFSCESRPHLRYLSPTALELPAHYSCCIHNHLLSLLYRNSVRKSISIFLYAGIFNCQFTGTSLPTYLDHIYEFNMFRDRCVSVPNFISCGWTTCWVSIPDCLSHLLSVHKSNVVIFNEDYSCFSRAFVLREFLRFFVN